MEELDFFMIDYWAKYSGKVNLANKQKRFNFIMDYIEKANKNSSEDADDGN